jgi:ABC-2 type transport system permease protein
MTATTVTTATVPQRHPRHGISVNYMGIELKRAGTRLITLVFCAAMPVIFYLIFGAMDGMDQVLGRGNVNAIMVGFMAFYGAAMTAATQGTTVAYERPLGWDRTLRLTPMRPWSYIATKVITALIASLISIAILYVVAALMGKAHMPGWLWLALVGVAMLGALTFGALGQAVSLVFRADVATGLIIPILLFCCFLSGVFAIPLTGSFFQAVQRIVPMGGMVNLTLALFGPDVQIPGNDMGGMTVGDWRIWVNLIGWIVAFVALAGWAWSRDTKRA